MKVFHANLCLIHIYMGGGLRTCKKIFFLFSFVESMVKFAPTPTKFLLNRRSMLKTMNISKNSSRSFHGVLVRVNKLRCQNILEDLEWGQKNSPLVLVL